MGGVYAKSFLCLAQLKVMLGLFELWLSWGFDNIVYIVSHSMIIMDILKYC